MTIALAKAAQTAPVPAVPGLSPRAARAVLAAMAKIANSAGEFRWGMRGVKIAELTNYSLSVVRRAQRHLVELGLLERITVGGGRYSTHWRIRVDNLAPHLIPGHNSPAEVAQKPDSPDTGMRPRPDFSRGWYERTFHPKPSQQPPRFDAASFFASDLCEHGGRAGLLDDGSARCPQCRYAHRLSHSVE